MRTIGIVLSTFFGVGNIIAGIIAMKNGMMAPNLAFGIGCIVLGICLLCSNSKEEDEAEKKSREEWENR